jgi:hypothetical protein
MEIVSKLTEWAANRGLSHIPLENLVFRYPSLSQGSHRSRATAAEGANDNHLRHAARLLASLAERSLHIGDQGVLIRVALNPREGLSVVQLPGPNLEGKSCPSEACMEAESLGNLISDLLQWRLWGND